MRHKIDAIIFALLGIAAGMIHAVCHIETFSYGFSAVVCGVLLAAAVILWIQSYFE